MDKRICTVIFGLLIFISCAKKDKNSIDKNLVVSNATIDSSYTEQYRPQFHFSPPSKWMNDPNGLVYYKGVYHLFYQHYPKDIVWGPMHWGHAISKDLVHWEHKPIALYPDEYGLIFSGSAVVDKNNTSGFGSTENPPLVAVFTYHLMEGEKAGRTDFQTQGIAYSLDNGDSWEKYEGNPVIGNDGSMKDFRDPKVFWHEESNQWIMVLVAGDHAKFYSSKDLKEWVYLSDFGKDKGAHGGVWECPDLFKLKVEGSDEEKWVLIISINPGAPNGGSGTQYFIGDFDGKTFTAEHNDIKWIDYGTDNYAGVTYNNEPNGDRIFIGWMSNWNYARNTPTKVWRSAMTLPRKLTLNKEFNNYYLKNYPIKVLDNLSKQTYYSKVLSIGKGRYIIEQPSFNSSRIEFKANLSNFLAVKLKNDLEEVLILNVNPEKSQLTLDRRSSGLVDFEESFSRKEHLQPIYKKIETEVSIILDKSSIEVFIDNGRYVFTDQIFPTKDYNRLEITSKNNIQLKDFKISKIKSIWNE